eukprot:TRINITY_DN1713_c0_g1_i2.p1 TRINITY_DN1713_c0_g1~~TRINITY_DN1713_c0_g1_i2.p1  ORF type:complete len:597 (+),score=182.67 TRINITY_DN1713_c0_g1_i2:29-1819(+)
MILFRNIILKKRNKYIVENITINIRQLLNYNKGNIFMMSENLNVEEEQIVTESNSNNEEMAIVEESNNGRGGEEEVPEGYVMIKEGKAKLLVKEDKVFYNEAMETNRDLSIAAANIFSDMIKKEVDDYKEKKHDRTKLLMKKRHNKERKDGELKILEALSASGLRSIRYLKELPDEKIHSITVNDIDENAYESIKMNLKYNNVEKKGIPKLNDANITMIETVISKDKYDYIDIDPYGSPHLFLDTAVQAVTDGGMLGITATDMAVLCGNYPGTCFTKYNAIPYKGSATHEHALRMLLASVQRSAMKHKKIIIPVLSLSIDYYIRVFVRVFTSASSCKQIVSNFSNVYQCVGCGSLSFQSLGSHVVRKNNVIVRHQKNTAPVKCEFCDSAIRMTGPIWGDSIHDQEFVEKLLEHLEENQSNYKTYARLYGLLSVIHTELPVPLFLSLPELSSHVLTNSIPLIPTQNILRNHGYNVSCSHTRADALKTDAPFSFIWDLAKHWANYYKQNNHNNDNIKNTVSKEKLTNGSKQAIASTILSKPFKHEIDFVVDKQSHVENNNNNNNNIKKITNKKGKPVRFVKAPKPYWGPGSRATANKR